MKIRYALSEIQKHWSDSQWWRKRFLTHVAGRYYTRIAPPDRTRLVDLDWDNLVLLDACRYDLFADALDEYDLPGELTKRRSAQSGTPGYLAENFAGGTFHDIVYVTANPYVNTELPDDTFHAVESVWDDGWDNDEQTVLPETMTERALEAADRYPDKRLLVHFNQPHAPFIGEPRLGNRNASAIRNRALGEAEPDPRERRPTPFELLGRGDVSYEDVWNSYLANLQRALPAVEELLESLEGRNVVTSDHGNALGEYARPFPIRVYGHPLGILIPALIEVPWHVYDNGPRKEIRAEAPVRSGKDVSEDTEDRLRMLGYAE